MTKKVIIIGSGFSGLASACFLAKAGFIVTVFEKNDSMGGRAREFSEQGFTFDMGPSWYWMPNVFEKFFANFNHKVSDFYDLTLLEPAYSVFFSEKEKTEIPANDKDLFALFEKLEAGSSKKLQQFLKEAQFKYEIGMQDLVYKPGLSITELIDSRVISGVFKMDVLQSLSKHVRRYFKNEKLIKLLEFPVLFLGAKPEKTPALYSLMNYADMGLKTWYPRGGMHKIIKGMVAVAKELGVEFHTHSPVEKIEVENKKTVGVIVKGKLHKSDFVIASSDYHFTEQNLLEEKYRNYTEQYWQKRVMAPSCLIFYMGINKKIKNLDHHNLFFDKDFKRHAEEIYDEPQWPAEPLFYVCCPSKTDNLVAPEGKENIFILMPLATGIEDNENLREKYFSKLIKRLQDCTGDSIEQNIEFKRSYCINDFVKDYNAFGGNAYGLANTLKQTANLKPSIRNKKVRNLYYTGQLTVPGPGVPPALVSGEVVANQIIKNS